MKRELRGRMRTVLRRMGADERLERSLEVCRTLREQPEWQQARTIFLYLPTGGEVDTTPLVEEGWRRGQRVLAPRIYPERVALSPVEVRSWSDCIPGYRGILEPVLDRPVELDAIDVVIVPGLAFDAHGGRLGTGGGFYDRFLARPDLRAMTCAVAFDSQVLDRLPVEPHDRPVDLLVTESRVQRCAPTAGL